MARHAEKRDANEPGIVDTLEAMGATVDRLPGGAGRPDLLVGFAGNTILMEVKIPGEKLNALQKGYHAGWKGSPIHVVFSVAEAIEVLQFYNRRQRCQRKSTKNCTGHGPSASPSTNGEGG